MSVRAQSQPSLSTAAGAARLLCAVTGVCFFASVGATVLDVRSFDGYGNNTVHPEWGQAKTTLLRKAAPPDPYRTTEAPVLPGPNPRDISNAIASQPLDAPKSDKLTGMVWQWGQFVDHDIDLTHSGTEYGAAPITVTNPTDPLWSEPIPFIPFARSQYLQPDGIGREQVNAISAYIDASGVYGSDAGTAAALREPNSARLRVGENNLLPTDADGFFVAGDVRVNEQVGLTAMHTLFMREHNRLVDAISLQRPDYSEDDVYHAARKIVGAEIQKITYEEFLPALLGDMAPRAADAQYKATINASITNEFSTALYRFGHSMLPSNLLVVDESMGESYVALRNAFFNPDLIKDDPSLVAGLLNGLSMQRTERVDNALVDDVRSFLFGPPGAGGLDLASLNIQRGRDHGLPGYNEVRVAYGLLPADSWSMVTSDPALQAALEAIYGSINAMDVWVGGLAEDHMPGASVGELVATAVIEQFKRLRDGDRFFYFYQDDWLSDEMAAVVDIHSLRLSDVIMANTPITGMRSNVFLVDEPPATLLILLGGIALLWTKLRARKLHDGLLRLRIHEDVVHRGALDHHR